MTHTAKHNPSEPAVVGIDIGKDVFHIVGFDEQGNMALLRKIKRLALIATFEKLPRCIVGPGGMPERSLRQSYVTPAGF